MSERVRITDVSPRDGLQNEAGVVPAAEKAALVRDLCAAGVDEVEITSFVSPKWIPQLADAGEVLADLRGTPVTNPPVFSVLVPNDRGYQRALEFCSDAFPLKMSVFTAASETFSQKNTNATIDETIERFSAFVPDALARGIDVRVYVSCVIACPYEGAIAPAAVLNVCDRLRALGPDDAWDRGQIELDLGDTIGAGTAENTAALLNIFSPPDRGRMTLHLHDTFGRAAECVRAGLDRGVRSFDGSVAGLGGCPYAGTPEKPAPGNISTETLVETCESAGFTTGVDRAALSAAADRARAMVAAARAGAGA